MLKEMERKENYGRKAIGMDEWRAELEQEAE